MTSKTWFITGVNSGFGRQMTEQLLSRGDRVAGTIRRAGSVDDLKQKYGERFWVADLDVTDLTGVRTTVDRAFAELGRIDVVVNNAGYGLFGAAEELTDEQVIGQINTNLLGSIAVVRAALPHLRAQGGGRVIQISTYGGQATNPGASLYHAGKWGIEGFIEGTARDVAPFGIEMTIVEPGGARTEFRFDSLQLATPLAAYDNTPAAMVRGAKDRSRPPLGDPAKMAARIIDSAAQSPAPLRLVLGSDAYKFVTTALRERLAQIEPQEALAASTDAG
ncbi:SDR family oxidoreductase [Paractinoplanes atraurantiacus]|uniref:NADP-dependent 3-hydroxy acid dehydrogenase YdfG n=1 Tax=Paractinoplanes atraurantiacus TaxID=1036182 RepID=A0A285ILB7_9ACTN|nr:SDR family oxidoreductase [Actinoplanes atraurantiacus]SNY47761.1 NADP-dependent 3-hydroxy acid dehydrogenase YdfG [Actinoplanes atraurantiacus]